MMKSVHAILMTSLSVALVAMQPSGVAAAEAGNAVGLHDTAPGEGAFRHLRALQDIASANGGNRAAGTAGYDRSAEYVAEKLREAGYAVRFEAFDFPFFEERTPPVLIVNASDGQQAPAAAAAFRTLNNSRRPAAAKPAISPVSSAAPSPWCGAERARFRPRLKMRLRLAPSASSS
jgi:hypothetical protein